MQNITIRKFEIKDAEAVSALISKTMRTTNINDYPAEVIENTIGRLTPENIIQRAGWMHFYVVCEGDTIIGCGAIGSYWGKLDESSLFNIFVLPEYQGKGVGRKIVETLEQDEFFLRAKRIEIPSSITASEFYRKLGYDYKNGVRLIDQEHHIPMEKFR